MRSKSDLVTRCQELMDLVKEQERELSAEVRSVYKDAEQVIEAEKKNFRSGYEDRLQKVKFSCPVKSRNAPKSLTGATLVARSSSRGRLLNTKKVPRRPCTRRSLACR